MMRLKIFFITAIFMTICMLSAIAGPLTPEDADKVIENKQFKAANMHLDREVYQYIR